jgi:hypothetical protein
VWFAMRTLLASSQYPVFKVQAQRGVTLLVVHPAVNHRAQLISEHDRPSQGMKNAPCWEASDGRGTAIRWLRPVIRLTSPTYDFSRSRSTQSQKRLGYSITAHDRTQENGVELLQ